VISPDQQLQLRKLLQQGLPLVVEPYKAIAGKLGVTEDEVLQAIRAMQDAELIKRFGMILRHQECGYTANAMVVWDVPNESVNEVGHVLGQQPSVTLSYRRPRRPPVWPYNLFCMIHGKTRESVGLELQSIIDRCELQEYEYRVLFSTRRFKQTGAAYV
jgi:DNA-binding Lrp family transcriptional regulator